MRTYLVELKVKEVLTTTFMYYVDAEGAPEAKDKIEQKIKDGVKCIHTYCESPQKEITRSVESVKLIEKPLKF